MIKASKSQILNKSIHSWWQLQLDVSQLKISSDSNNGEEKYDSFKDPSLEENVFKSFDGVAFDELRKKTWVRFGLRDHIMWLEDGGSKSSMVFNDFIPETNIQVYYTDFMRKEIPVLTLLAFYLKNNWNKNPYFTLPQISIEKCSFGKQKEPKSGILISGTAKDCEKKGIIRENFLTAWRDCIFKSSNGFYRDHKYNDNHNDLRSLEQFEASEPDSTKRNPYFPLKPSLEHGFIQYLERINVDRISNEIAAEKRLR